MRRAAKGVIYHKKDIVQGEKFHPGYTQFYFCIELMW
jgi:hypothetical protein